MQKRDLCFERMLKNFCKFGKDLSQFWELRFRIMIFHWNKLAVCNVAVTSHLIIMIQITFLIEHFP